ncbi:MAG: hypothetical protein JWO91_2799 [Acidobacteriaceae bacterium]|nr:hypothetical protein [Acidobacteriaceae bacterium]
MPAIDVVPRGIRILAMLCVVLAPAIEIAADGSADTCSEDPSLVPPEGSRSKNAILPPS